ncbi:MAG: protease complex subunit PrcB family protein [Proteobacteria bacterium]|nr:protease complex subunit PrcB family protein [Pseudomonadota bacterium]
MMPRRHGLGVLLIAAFATFATAASAQTVRQWSGTNALTRHPEQVLASTTAEWRSLWSRVGMAAPDMFEPGRTSAVGIFLGVRAGPGYSVNIISASRRRDRIMVVFEERAPDEVMMAERAPPVAVPPVVPTPSAPRPVATGPAFAGGGASAFAPNGTASLATPVVPVVPTRPAGPPTSPWAIVLINRVDLPITVEQRLFR